eukprot:363337-Chlamydomonas_euryale.AAC.2
MIGQTPGLCQLPFCSPPPTHAHTHMHTNTHTLYSSHWLCRAQLLLCLHPPSHNLCKEHHEPVLLLDQQRSPATGSHTRKGCTTLATPAMVSTRPCHTSSLLGLLKFQSSKLKGKPGRTLSKTLHTNISYQKRALRPAGARDARRRAARHAQHAPLPGLHVERA